MVFSSPIFLFLFMPILLAVYFAFQGEIRNYILLIFSLIFYAWGGPHLLLLMFFVVGVDYIAALVIDSTKKCRLRTLCLIITIVINLGLLGYFKYTMFLLNNVNRLFSTNFLIPEIVLPIGISFFTFQAMSYVFDVYKRDCKAQKNLFYVLLYVALFPQLVAGPIVRYTTVENEIISRKTTLEDFANGLERFIIGFAKKLIIANNVGELADLVYKNVNVDTSLAWLGAFAYTLQIYFDFSAYSDMAIGLGKILGFHFDENFNYPYIAKSITEFWRRWHISLSTWFRDYVYIPLGGNRKGIKRQIINMLVVWTLTGLWHGASWNFIFWGLYYFVLLTFEKIFLGNILKRLPSLIQWLYTFICVMFGWVLFRVDYMRGVIKYITYMLDFHVTEYGLSTSQIYLNKYGIYLLLGCLFSVPIFKWMKLLIVRIKGNRMLSNNLVTNIMLSTKYFILLCVFFVSVLYLVNTSYNPFIYFRF